MGTEEFSEWIIQDRFAGARPPWDSAGAIFTPDVTPFEERKLRMLNAAHSYLAYAGLLAGHTYVHQAIHDPVLRDGVNALWDEAALTISAPASDTLDSYRAALLARFSVPTLRHELHQIAMDGSLKLQQRAVPIIQERNRLGLASPATLKAVDKWIAFVRNSVTAGIQLHDPSAQKITALIRDSASPLKAHTKLCQLIGLHG